jgi:hypothetical protein
MLVLPKPIKAGAEEGDEAKEFAETYAEVEKKVKVVSGTASVCWFAINMQYR